MAIAPHIKAKHHIFMPGDTVGGVIKKYNLFDVQPEEMVKLLKEFNDANKYTSALKPGMSGLIPILERHHEMVFNHSEIR